MLSSYRPRLLALPLFGLSLVGCGEIEQAPPPLHPKSKVASEAPRVAKAEGETVTDEHERGVREDALAPRVRFEDVEDGHQALAKAIVDASKAPMQECRGETGGGSIRIR